MLNKCSANSLQYIGKSNKKFTYKKLYRYCSFNLATFYISVYANKNQLVVIKDRHYFFENFKELTEQDILKIERLKKLKRIKNLKNK